MIAAIAKRLGAYDRSLAAATLMLAAAGLVLSLAASPAATAKVGYADAFDFTWRHAAFLTAGAVVFGVAASLSARGVRRIATVFYVGCLAMMALVLLVGVETKGATRWLQIGSTTIQPSEFLKPALVVLLAWMLSERMKRRQFPGIAVSCGLFGLAAILLLAQPDVGQTALLSMCFAILLFASGVAWTWLAGGAALAAGAGFALYHLLPHVKARIDALAPGNTSFQVSRALDAISAGGALGRGPGEGVFKRTLPDAHSDFIYSVAAEEFGLFASIGFIALYGAIAWRGLMRASRLADPFAQLAALGLIALFTLQAGIHIAVNVGIAPAKGMTLPLISYGGSSMLASALTLGMAFALTRKRPGAFIYESDEPLP
ncbi:MAG TPA: putative peptidoglycan glycosyltransferase FtsW [Caulobacterales bacterium]|jgi:cell division protein FtsW|nr:putative peptidoglycan glycosyltransferase FtsW [Caulobacterales bacterium]